MAEFMQQEKAPFNMALNTLERIGDILRLITKNSYEMTFPPEIRQAIKVQLVKELFINSSPLLSETVVTKYKPKFLKMKPFVKTILKEQSAGDYSKSQQEKHEFSFTLESELDVFILDISRELQKERYFMPPKEDLSRAAARMS